MTDPIQAFSEWMVYDLLNLARDSKFGTSLDFFFYDSIKIILLLFLMVFIMGIVRTYISPKTIRNFLTRKTPGLSNIFASCFGALTPFCSCSSIPIYISFLEAGAPLGVASSFLITSPLVNEYVAVLMFGFFGIEVAVAYIFAGIILGTLGGILIGRLGLEKHIVKDMLLSKDISEKSQFSSLKARLEFGYYEAKKIIKKIWLWVLVGVGIGAIIHGFIPKETIETLVGAGGVFSVPLAVLIGIPIYANCSAVVPIAVALFQKGAPLGTSLAFMMATAALSLPEAIILRRVMRLPLLALFFGFVGLGIILIGYLFNILF